MTILRSNIYRLLFRDGIFKYTLKLAIASTRQPAMLDLDEKQQLENFLLGVEPFALTDLNYLYLPYEWPHLPELTLMLLRGEQIRITILPSRIESNQTERRTTMNMIVQRTMQNTKFLQCQHLKACFNPFDQRQMSATVSEMPGFSIDLQEENNNFSWFIKPILLETDLATSISEEGELFVDVTTGRFVKKTEVVRVEKKDEATTFLHFRNRQIIDKRHLKLCTVRDCVGVQLAACLKRTIERIDLTSKDFFARWGLQLDNRPVDMQLSFVDPGMLVLGKIQKSLNDIIFPLARNSYNSYYKQVFDVPFDSFPEVEIVVCFGQRTDRVEKLRTCLQSIRSSMNLNIKIGQLCLPNNLPETWSDLLSGQMNRTPLYIFVLQEPLPLSALLEPLVRQAVLFEVIKERELSSTDQSLNEVTALRHLGVICSKLRSAPWKLKNIPFGELPLSVASLSLERKRNGMVSVALVFSLNSFLSKFISDIGEAQESQVEQLIAKLLLGCLEKFREVHRIYPVRLFVFVLGTLPQSVAATHNFLKDRIQSHFLTVGYSKLNTLTLVKVGPSESIRLYSQINTIISEDTVKEPGLLSYLQFNKKMYIQLQLHQPITELEVSGEEMDATFTKKLTELTVRLAFGSVGGKYGGGYGFLSFAKKLNSFREYEPSLHWKKYLQDGNMIFL